MLFYILSADELRELFSRLGYPFERETIPQNVQYYLTRTSHGSTLSRVVHSWVLARSGREISWNLFREALESDICDIQGGTTHEGIHLGAMAGTVDILQRAYSGIETRGEVLWFNPSLPKGLKSVRFNIKYRGHWLNVNINETLLRITSTQPARLPVKIGFKDQVFEMKPAATLEFELIGKQPVPVP
jgi:alpha,alpha-trehalase